MSSPYYSSPVTYIPKQDYEEELKEYEKVIAQYEIDGTQWNENGKNRETLDFLENIKVVDKFIDVEQNRHNNLERRRQTFGIQDWQIQYRLAPSEDEIPEGINIFRQYDDIKQLDVKQTYAFLFIYYDFFRKRNSAIEQWWISYFSDKFETEGSFAYLRKKRDELAKMKPFVHTKLNFSIPNVTQTDLQSLNHDIVYIPTWINIAESTFERGRRFRVADEIYKASISHSKKFGQDIHNNKFL